MEKEIRILYLAKYAPNNNGTRPPYDELHKVYAEYHYKIYQILTNNFGIVISSNNPSLILKPPKEINYVFSLFNRFPIRNSEIFVSSVAEYYKLSYLGAPPNIRALAEDKYLTKMLAQYANIPTAKGAVYSKVGNVLQQPQFDGPYFIKPRFGASSMFIEVDSICNTWDEAKARIYKLFELDQDVILEEFIDGVYYTSPVLNNFSDTMLLPCIEEISNLAGNVVTYEQKRKLHGGLTRKILNDKNLSNQLMNYSKRLFNLIQPLDYTRFDYIVDKEKGIPHLLEFNVCCNLGENSTVSQAAKQIGINYEQLILNIIYSSFWRNGLSDRLDYKF